MELSETELEILKSLWEHGPATVREVHERLAGVGRQWAYTTVLTFLMRLEAKGYAASTRAGAANVFRAVVDREMLLKQRLGHLARDLCDGMATPLVKALVQGQKFSADEIDQFRRLLDELESNPGRSSDKPRRKRGS
jgi:predicted transcriptional regulator